MFSCLMIVWLRSAIIISITRDPIGIVFLGVILEKETEDEMTGASENERGYMELGAQGKFEEL